MENLGKYILSVTCAAILFAILRSILGKKSTAAALLRLIGGLFLTFIIISPIMSVNLDRLFDMPQNYLQQANTISAEGKESTRQQLCSNIKAQCETYILDKAKTYQTDLEVEVILSDAELPIPVGATLHGNISPFAKSAMKACIANDIGITEENQTWTE